MEHGRNDTSRRSRFFHPAQTNDTPLPLTTWKFANGQRYMEGGPHVHFVPGDGLPQLSPQPIVSQKLWCENCITPTEFSPIFDRNTL